MNIINIEHISKVYGEKVIFDDASYGIQEGDKIGIIGINGTGKTTLLNMIAGREETDSGSIIRQNGLHMAYLSQNPVYEKEDTVLSFVTRGIDPSDRTAISEAKSNLMTLGLTDYEEKLEHLSGGQRKKAALARVLLGSFDVLILDEPTFASGTLRGSSADTFGISGEIRLHIYIPLLQRSHIFSDSSAPAIPLPFQS